MSICYCYRPDRNCEKCNTKDAQQIKLSHPKNEISETMHQSCLDYSLWKYKGIWEEMAKR